MKKLLKLSLTAFIAINLISAISAADEKDYYGRIDPKIRLNLIANMHVKKILKAADSAEPGKRNEDDKDNLIEKIDVVKYLSEKCDFEYTRDQQGNPVRPQVSCVYKPRVDGDDFGGMSAKYDCTFSSQNKDGQVKERTLKVKYAPQKYDGGGYKEIPQAVLGTSIARLLGFYTSTYCPVDVTCKDCPNEDPWHSNKSKAAAVPGTSIEFKNVVVEVKQKGFKVVDSHNADSTEPQGFSFAAEMNRYFPKDKQAQAALATERDALTLWINFVMSQDADRHNNKLVCVKSTKPATPDEKPVCELSAGMINDYGNSFGFKDGSTRLSVSKFSRDAMSGTETTGASGDSRASMYTMSKAGRDLFVTMAEGITDQQLQDVLSLAQIEKVSDGSVDAWKQTFRKKVQKIKDVKFH